MTDHPSPAKGRTPEQRRRYHFFWLLVSVAFVALGVALALANHLEAQAGWGWSEAKLNSLLSLLIVLVWSGIGARHLAVLWPSKD